MAESTVPAAGATPGHAPGSAAVAPGPETFPPPAAACPAAPLLFGVPRDFNDCVHCGLCLNACPTYLETGQEPDSPRGRIYLMKGLAEGRYDLAPEAVRHLELCLGCRACETACPSGVRYGHLLEEARGWLRDPGDGPQPLPLFQRFLISRVMTDPGRFRLAIQATRAASRIGLGGLAGLLMPEGFDAAGWAGRLAPAERPVLPLVTPAVPPVHGRVAFLTGCVMDGLFGAVNAATVRLLAREGWEVHVPRDQVCCGALPAHAGLLQRARDLAQQNERAFRVLEFDYLVTNAAGCGATLKEGPGALASRARDISEVLALHPLRGPIKPRAVKTVYHDACHLAHGQKITAEPRALLAQVPGLTLLPLAECDLCCGSAGSYNITEADMAGRLGARKARRILESGAELVVAGNAGCLVQMRVALEAAAAACDPPRETPRVRHLVEILAG